VERGIVDAFALDPDQAGRVDPRVQVGEPYLVERHGDGSERRPIEEERDRGIVVDQLEISGKARSRERREGRVLRRIQVPEVPSRGAEREFVGLEQHHREASPGQLVRTRGPDDPATDDHRVRHTERRDYPCRLR
jgi:hypothetical protein